MNQTEALKSALLQDAPQSKRQLRAARTRARALSPVRILRLLLAVPVVAAGLTVSIYIRTSPYEPPDALRHLIALSGCSAAVKVGVAPAYAGELGYHLRNDPDGDGVACGSEVAGVATFQFEPAQKPVVNGSQPVRAVGGAKFLRP